MSSACSTGSRDLSERINALIREFDLEKFRNVKCGVLSSGEQTRVALAKAMLNQPHLLLLDEPTASLDPVAAREIRARIRQFAVSGDGGVLWTTHNIFTYHASLTGCRKHFSPTISARNPVVQWQHSVMPKNSSNKTVKAKNPAAVALAKLGASKGGRARAAKLSGPRRSEIARRAVETRWRNYRDSERGNSL